ncbi:hypothetical protein AMATHDRAFT_135037 [Amanita thiersii Skay4041]|uniref:SCP domain-containing protein n=1 Tax=Amanita thiersii Skay4041 TaxID=703135 RepID=A0A2A9P1M5_9AGAR|nr:hypothetical protein AMATHDRAFT_135037 [Amanita thiersii Skay4041]
MDPDCISWCNLHKFGWFSRHWLSSSSSPTSAASSQTSITENFVSIKSTPLSVSTFRHQDPGATQASTIHEHAFSSTVVGPSSTVITTTSAPQSTSSVPDSQTLGGDIETYLSAHNKLRAQHGANPLTWNEELASKAQQWANDCHWGHSGGTLGSFGENLAAGTGSTFDIASAVKAWTDEVDQYDPNNPVPSHFTQVVWKSTSEVGCAMQSCHDLLGTGTGVARYYVCEYSSPGNVIGHFA